CGSRFAGTGSARRRRSLMSRPCNARSPFSAKRRSTGISPWRRNLHPCSSMLASRTFIPKETTMQIFFINNHGGGFADHIDVEPGTNITQLLKQRLPHCRPQDYLIRVNRQPVAHDEVLKEGDRVSVTPIKIEGAGLSDS